MYAGGGAGAGAGAQSAGGEEVPSGGPQCRQDPAGGQRRQGREAQLARGEGRECLEGVIVYLPVGCVVELFRAVWFFHLSVGLCCVVSCCVVL